MKSVTPHFFFTFLAKVNHYLSTWQVLKKSVRGNFWARTSLKSVFAESSQKALCPTAEIQIRYSQNGKWKKITDEKGGKNARTIMNFCCLILNFLTACEI